MSFPHGVPTVSLGGSVYATAVRPVSQQMMVPMTPVRHVTLVPVSNVVMRPVVTSQPTTIRTIAAPPRIVQTMQFNPISAVIPSRKSVSATHSIIATDSNSIVSSSQNNTHGNVSPPVTVFVGNITERASDTLVRQILMKCGTVYAWKRVQGASGKLQAFGFCEYKDVEAALCAIHLLHDFKLGDKKLLVKVDAKTQDVINKWKKEKGLETPENSDFIPPNVNNCKTGLDVLMKEYASELNTSVNHLPEKEPVASSRIEEPVVRESHNVEENLKSLDLEDSEKDFISKEIRSFRTAQKQKEEERKKVEERKKKERLDREKREEEREKQKQREREEQDREKERERAKRDVHSRTPSRRREISNHARPSPPRIRRRSRTPERGNRARSPPRRRSRSRSIHGPRSRRSHSRSDRRHDEEGEDDEAYERRRMERKIREKEAAYQERLRAWEMRERRRKREYEKRDDREQMTRKEMIREAKRLQEFLADYDDSKMDHKYYTGGAMMKRRREYEREQESDGRDRKKEQEEIEALKQRLVQENHPDPESAIAKALKETEDVWKPLLKTETPPRKKDRSPENDHSSTSSSSDSDSDSEQKSGSNSSDSEEESGDEKISENAPRLITANLVPVADEPKAVTVTTLKQETNYVADTLSQNGESTPQQDGQSIKMEFYGSSPAVKQEYSSHTSPYKAPPLGIPKQQEVSNVSAPVMQIPGASQRKKLKVSDVFNQDYDEEEVPKKRKLVPLEYTHEERNAVHPARSAEDKRKMVRALIEKIPTKKEDLFDFNLDWTMVDQTLMEKRIQPWITKKIVEYIGEDEPTLVEFICSKIMSKSSPERIFEDISMVLDDEAEVFVVKMWRLLIYETEAKKEGLTK